MLTFHPVLHDPRVVALLRFSVPADPQHADFFQAAHQAASVLQLAADGDLALKPNATAAERFQSPDSGIGTHPGFVWGLVDYVRSHGADGGSGFLWDGPDHPTWPPA